MFHCNSNSLLVFELSIIILDDLYPCIPSIILRSHILLKSKIEVAAHCFYKYDETSYCSVLIE